MKPPQNPGRFNQSRDQDYRPWARADGPYIKLFSYDPSSNIENLFDFNSNTSLTYAYDATGRLVSALDSASNGFGILAWAYDKNGNRQSETRNAGTMPYVYSPPNWLYQKGSETRPRTANGNTQSTGTISFAYDGYNRLISSQTAAETTTYTYNALGQRIRKINQNGLATSFHYGPDGELLYEQDQAGNSKAYVWLNGRPLARIDNDAQIYYYHVDHLGTPQAMTDATGTVVWKAYYDPFGGATLRVSTIENNLRFPGQYYDRETGMQQNYFRDYDATTDRYLEFDPSGLDGGLNGYEYARSNPLIYTDPLGLAYFASRPLSGLPWLGSFSQNPLDDFFNTEISHEQLFFEDGKGPSNLGYFDDSKLKEEPNPTGYRRKPEQYNDCIMRKAVARAKLPRSYCLIGKNCQTWVDRVRKEYKRLANDPVVQRECEVCK